MDQQPKIDARNALLDHLPKDRILARYESAGGDELTSGKFASPESSAALAANAFGFFVQKPELLALPKPEIRPGEALEVELEVQMRFPWAGGLHPWLDVVIRTPTHLIGIESKRYEPFRGAKKAEFSDAYARPVWGANMAPYERMRDALRQGRSFEYLDAAQLVKHAFGLRTQASRQNLCAVLLYLYSEPKTFPDGRPLPENLMALHRAEISSFASDVCAAGCEVEFCSLSYGELLSRWSDLPDLRNHVAALRGKFNV